MAQTRYGGEMELIRQANEDDILVVGDIRIGGVSPIATWPPTKYGSDVELTWQCAAKDASGKVRGKPGMVARAGDSLAEDWDGRTTDWADWAVLEIGDRDIIPQLVLLEGAYCNVRLSYEPARYPNRGFPKGDYEEAAGWISQWAACRYNGYTGGAPGRISVEQVAGLYSTGIFAWVGISPEYQQEEAHYERFAEVRWADGEGHAKQLRDAWVAELVEAGRRTRAEYNEIVRTHRCVIFTDAGGAPYVGTIVEGTYPHEPITVKWHWHWSPVAPLDNPVVDPGGLSLLSAVPTDEQLLQLGQLAKAVSDGTLADTTEKAKTQEWVRPAAWPFWTQPQVAEAVRKVGLDVVDLPKCWGTEASDYLPKQEAP